MGEAEVGEGGDYAVLSSVVLPLQVSCGLRMRRDHVRSAINFLLKKEAEE